jgi:hypothetical protein
MMNAVRCAIQDEHSNVLAQEISVFCLVAYMLGGAIKESVFHISHFILLLNNKLETNNMQKCVTP